MMNASRLRTIFDKIKKLNKPYDLEEFYDKKINKLIEDKKKIKNVHVPIYFKNVKNMSYFLYLPLVYTTGSIAVDLMFWGSFSPYKVTSAINNVFLINCYNTGIVYGFKDYFVESTSDERIAAQFILTGVTLFLSHFLTTASMPVFTFYPLYIIYFFFSKYLANEVDKVYIGYRLQFNLILIITMTILLMCITIRYKDYRNKLKDAQNVNEAVKSHMLFNDAKFKEQMNHLEKYVDELAIKLPKDTSDIKH